MAVARGVITLRNDMMCMRGAMDWEDRDGELYVHIGNHGGEPWIKGIDEKGRLNLLVAKFEKM